MESEKVDRKYVKMEVVGNPIDKSYLNTDIKLVTSELMIVFYPKIIAVVTEFIRLQINKENTEAAIEKYGEIKEITTNVVSESIDQPTKKQIGADLFFNSITITVPFNPKQTNGDCWGVSLGCIHFTTDE